jgi:hypothetical protein
MKFTQPIKEFPYFMEPELIAMFTRAIVTIGFNLALPLQSILL